MNKYVVCMAVDGRIDLEIEADDPDDAYVKAMSAFGSADLSRMEVVDGGPVSCKDDETGKIVKEYRHEDYVRAVR